MGVISHQGGNMVSYFSLVRVTDSAGPDGLCGVNVAKAGQGEDVSDWIQALFNKKQKLGC